jgi:hypothetical protein
MTDPGVLRLVAEVVVESADGSGKRWLRILGDDERGYLLPGDLESEGGPPLADFWFPTLNEALDEAAAAGVARDAWDVDASTPAEITARAKRRASKG